MSLYLHVSPQVEARFTAAARERGLAPAELFERLVEENLPEASPVVAPNGSNGRTVADMLMELGGIDGLPSDMSENRAKYLKGFGETTA